MKTLRKKTRKVSSPQPSLEAITALIKNRVSHFEAELLDDVQAALEAHRQPLAVQDDTDPAEGVAINEALMIEVTGIHLRRIAAAKGVSLKELAHRMKVHPSMVTRLFQHPERAEIKTLHRLARALHVPLAGLFSPDSSPADYSTGDLETQRARTGLSGRAMGQLLGVSAAKVRHLENTKTGPKVSVRSSAKSRT